MCGEQSGPGGAKRFDPTRCPLLQGLTSEEADRVMRADARIRACIAAIEAGEPDLEPCVADSAGARGGSGAAAPRVA